jgi:hypothetical protein
LGRLSSFARRCSSQLATASDKRRVLRALLPNSIRTILKDHKGH